MTARKGRGLKGGKFMSHNSAKEIVSNFQVSNYPPPLIMIYSE